MISHGWKTYGTSTFGTGGNSAPVTEFATELQADHVIECTGYSWALIAFATTGIGLHTLNIWGTQGSAESAQNNKFYINHSLVTVSTGLTPSSAISLPAGTVHPSLDLENYQIASVNQTANGVSNSPGLIGIFYNIVGTRGLQADGASNTGETNSVGPYYANYGSSAGPSWIAIPCAAFDYIQCVANVTEASTFVTFANTLS